MSSLLNKEKLFKVLIGPIFSEKSAVLSDENKHIVFNFIRTETNSEIKAAVELLFKNVKVKDVTVVNVKGKKKRFALRLGKRQDWKKAYVSLSEGDINFATAEAG